MSLDEKISNYASNYDLSDFHIRSNQPLALRENGSILVFEEDIISRQELENFWKSHLNKSQLQEIVNSRDLDFAVIVGDYRYRANGYYTANGPSMVLRKIVSENKIDVKSIKGSGKDGRVLKGDLIDLMGVNPPTSDRKIIHGQEERIKITRLRQTIAKRLKQAQENAALLTTFNEVDMSNIMQMRKENQ